MEAARDLGDPVELVVASDRRNALEHLTGGTTFQVNFDDAADTLRAVHANADNFGKFSAVVSADDESSFVAAYTAAALGLPGHSPDAVRAARDKLATRRAMRAASMRTPRFVPLDQSADPEEALARVHGLGWPLVIKPTSLSMSRGVLRVEGPEEFPRSFARVSALLASLKSYRGTMLAEQYLPGDEVAVEGLVSHEDLHVLAIFDKPEPLVGPTFPETLYVTPSRHSKDLQRHIVREVEAGCRALGLDHGPIHAEVRLTPSGPTLLEIAPRSIGGQCARVFTWAMGTSLERVIYRQALGLPVQCGRAETPAGVLMLPVPASGQLLSVDVAQAASLDGVQSISITHKRGQTIPLPEGDKYLGFVFAVGTSPAHVEEILRTANDAIEVDIELATGLTPT
jgi:biotin carboxylase